ncbi:hypothetical protein [Deinococcus sp.]|uniref:hypothetical protein n=1 Tax=Deinococcus sp. TaxID=47478 RepID=UPI003B5C5DE5
MPNIKPWSISSLDIPSAYWNISDDIRKSSVKVDTNLQLKREGGKINQLSLETVLTFFDSEDASKNYGSICVNSRAMISYNPDLDIVNLSDFKLKELISDVISALSGNNRSEMKKIASAAGLDSPLILPIFQLTDEEMNSALTT